jgi:hypothetical protein
VKTSEVESLIENFEHVHPAWTTQYATNAIPGGGYEMESHTYPEYVESGWYEWAEKVSSVPEVTEVPELGKVTIVDAATGGEGAAEHIYMVFKVEFDDGSVKHYEKTGYYMSYEGSDWDGGFYRVDPKQVTVTKYTQVKED